MTLRAKIGLVAAVLFTLLNVGGVWIAGVERELYHALIHVVFAYVGAFVSWRLLPRRVATH